MELPIYQIKGKFYFLDKRLQEYRNVKDFNDRINYDEVSLNDLDFYNNGNQDIYTYKNGYLVLHKENEHIIYKIVRCRKCFV